MTQPRKEQINTLRAHWSTYTYTATGLTTSTVLPAGFQAATVTQTAGGNASTPTRGIVTTSGGGYVKLRYESDGSGVFDGYGVYGRLTNSSSTYTVSYKKLVAGVETAATLPIGSFTVRMVFQEVMTNGEVPANANVLEGQSSFLSEGTGGVSDHGVLTGLLDDDHIQYFLVNGTRAVTGNLVVNGNTALGDAATDTVSLTGRLNTGVKFINTLVTPVISQDAPITPNTTGKNLEIFAQSASGTGFGGHLNLYAGNDSLVTNRANINIAGSSTGLAGGIYVYSAKGTNGNFGGELYMAAGSIESFDANPVNGTAGGVGIYAGNRPLEGGTGNPGGIEIASGIDSFSDAVGAINIQSGDRVILNSSNYNTSLLGGKGKNAFGATAGTIGGTLTIKAGNGGNGITGLSPGNGNNVTITGGNGGTGGLSNRNGGNVIIDGGAASGTGTNGTISLGGVSTSSITIGAAGKTVTASGSLVVAENLTVNGSTAIGDATTDTVSLTARLSTNLNFLSTQSSPTITQDTPVTDTAPQSLTLKAQAPFSAATGVNRSASNVIFDLPAPIINGSTGRVLIKTGGYSPSLSTITIGSDGYDSASIVPTDNVFQLGVGGAASNGIIIDNNSSFSVNSAAMRTFTFSAPWRGAVTMTAAHDSTTVTYQHAKRVAGADGYTTDGYSTSLLAQSGMNVVGGVNRNGGNLVLASGAVGTGGTGGLDGSLLLNTGATTRMTLNNSGATLNAGSLTISTGDLSVSGSATLGTFLAVGTGPVSTTGLVRTGINQTIIASRGSGNANDIPLFTITSAQVLNIGSAGTLSAMDLSAAGSIAINAGGNVVLKGGGVYTDATLVAYRNNATQERKNARNGTVNTTGATTASVVTFAALIPSGRNLMFTGYVVGYQSGGTENVAYEIIANIYNNAGTYSLTTAPTVTYTSESAGATAATVDIVISGTSVILQVTGVAAITIAWTGWFEAMGQIS